MSTKYQLAGAASLAAILAAGSANAQTVSADQIDKLQAQIEILQRELKQLKGKVNAAPPAPQQAYAADLPGKISKVPPPPPTAIVRMSAGNRPSICTPDGLNCIAFTSRIHLDTGGYWYDPNTRTGFLVPAGPPPQHLDAGVNARRARIGVLGTFMGDWNYALIYDFGGTSDGFGGTVASTSTSTGGVTTTTATALLPGGATSGIENAYLSYTGFKPFGGNLAIEGGYMDVLYTLDESTSSNDIMFMERASSNVIATNIAAGDFRSAFGARWWNNWAWVGAYLTGPASGAIHSGSSALPNAATEQYGVTARAAFQVISERDYSLHIGGDFQALLKPAFNRVSGFQTLTLSDRPELRIDPTTLISAAIGGSPVTGTVTGAQVYSAEVAGQYGPFYFQGEYYHYNVDRSPVTPTGVAPSLKFDGGYVQASWTLTGESRAYNAGAAAYGGIVPRDPWSLVSSGWGAWEIAARYSVVDLNDRLGFADGVAGGKQEVFTAGLNWYVNRNVRFMLNYLHGTVDRATSATVLNNNNGSTFDALAMRTQVAF
jgi:phosphate-selective porin OprO/OprP